MLHGRGLPNGERSSFAADLPHHRVASSHQGHQGRPGGLKRADVPSLALASEREYDDEEVCGHDATSHGVAVGNTWDLLGTALCLLCRWRPHPPRGGGAGGSSRPPASFPSILRGWIAQRSAQLAPVLVAAAPSSAEAEGHSPLGSSLRCRSIAGNGLERGSAPAHAQGLSSAWQAMPAGSLDRASTLDRS